jgi:hypothetical protein
MRVVTKLRDYFLTDVETTSLFALPLLSRLLPPVIAAALPAAPTNPPRLMEIRDKDWL